MTGIELVIAVAELVAEVERRGDRLRLLEQGNQILQAEVERLRKDLGGPRVGETEPAVGARG